ncbi:MAG: amidohydrolase family protein [Clostridiales Family XIII bacterium]|jgi:ABC-type glutathione transport system ATPase component/predicted amidohydrolase YtcJ|nr:amidohydrolase family protein [Clostridiales Family XIII bacterium]
MSTIARDTNSTITLSIRDLRVNIAGKEILRGIDFDLNEDISIGIVGESGSGKTMFVRSAIGLLPPAAEVTGEYEIDGAAFRLNAKESKWRKVRGSEIGMIMQDPFTALDPLKKCGRQILNGVPGANRKSFDLNAALAEVGLPEKVAQQHPFELSGGMRQRVVIAAALATEPKLLIADEATTALDVITQREILDLIDEIRVHRGMPLILITHDIKLARQRTDKIIVMERGQIVESGDTKEVIDHPKEDYTKMLIDADRFLNVSAYPEYAVGGEILLKVDHLVRRFGKFTALDDVSIEVGEGECVGIVGESGSGKTTLARCIAGLSHAQSGTIKYFGKGSPQIVFQDPYSSLNPAHTVRYILEEALTASGRPKSELGELIGLAEIEPELLDRKPAKLSGGQRQRVAIARSLAPHPDLLICDESVSALDIVIQNQILRTIERLRKERGLAIIFITHDLSVVRMIASRIYVMHDAKVVEEGSTERIFEGTKDPYTKELIAASSYGRVDVTEQNMWKPGDLTPPLKNTLYKNAKIYTVSPNGSVSETGDSGNKNGADSRDGAGSWDENPQEAMAVGSDGLILYVGTEEDTVPAFKGKPYETVDLGGRAVLPGFIDTHVHMPGSAMTELFEIYLYKARNLEETLKEIETFVRAHPERDAYFGTGFYMSVAGTPEGPRREWLDEIEPDKPIILNSSDGHSYWLNSAALQRLGVTKDTEPPPGGLIQKDRKTGEPSGILTDTPQLITLQPEYTAEQVTEALRHFQRKQAAWGYTAAMHIAPHFCDPFVLKKLVGSGEWKMRVNLSALADPDTPIEEALAEAKAYEESFVPTGADDLVRTTAVKFFADGVVEGGTAYLKEPYAEVPGTQPGYRSELIWNIETLEKAFEAVVSAGYQLHVHSIGDAATADTLNAIKTARAAVAMPEGNRDVLTHLQLVDREEIDMMKELGIIASYQPFWHFKEPFWYEEIDESYLGQERAEAAYPVGSIIRSGVVTTFSGDYPASPVNDPFWAIQNAVTRNLSDPAHYGVEPLVSPDDANWLRNPEERITLKEAIEAYTINGAYQLFREAEIGSLEPGKYADFIVLNADPFAAPPTELYAIKPERIYFSGREYKPRNSVHNQDSKKK